MNEAHIEQNVRGELKAVGRNTAIYSAGNVGIKLVSFLLIPLYTHRLSQHDVGIIVLLELVEVFYGYVAPLGVVNGIWRFFYRTREEGNEKRFLASNYAFLVVANVILLAALISLGGPVARYVLSDESQTQLTRVFFVTLFLGLNKVFVLTLLRMYERAFQFILLVLVYFITLISLTVWFVAGLDMGLWGVVYAKLITSGFIFAASLIYLIRLFGFSFRCADVLRSLKYGMPLVLHGASLLVLSMAGRYVVKEVVSLEAGGVYGIAQKFGMILNMVLVTPFIQAWQPRMFKLENDPHQRLTYQKTALYFVQIGMVLWLAVSVGSKYLIQWSTTEPYHAGAVIVPFIAFSYLCFGLQSIFRAGALLHNATVRFTAYGLLTAALSILLNIIFTQEWGLLGAAVATVLSYFVLLSLIISLSQKYLRVNWLWKKMLAVVVLGMVVYVVSFIEVGTGFLELLKDTCVVILLPVLMMTLGLASLGEITRFVRAFLGR